MCFDVFGTGVAVALGPGDGVSVCSSSKGRFSGFGVGAATIIGEEGVGGVGMADMLPDVHLGWVGTFLDASTDMESVERTDHRCCRLAFPKRKATNSTSHSVHRKVL